LVGLLSHENADIALDIIELIHELTDEDVGEEDEDDDDDDPDQREAALKSLINALVRLVFIKEGRKLRLRALSWTSLFWSYLSIT
jgi:hypothetical protein